MADDRDHFLMHCPTYNDYLDTFITKDDVAYIRNSDIARRIVTLGHRSATEIYSPEEFEIRKAAALEALFPTKKSAILFSTFLKSEDPVIKALAAREELNKNKIIATIFFLRHISKSGFEISAYVDYEESLRKANAREPGARDWRAIFEGKTKLVPKRTDLSFYDWHQRAVSSHNSYNWTVIDKHEVGLMFKHTGDHKIVSTDAKGFKYRENCTRNLYHSETYGAVVCYDHVVKKKA